MPLGTSRERTRSARRRRQSCRGLGAARSGATDLPPHGVVRQMPSPGCAFLLLRLHRHNLSREVVSWTESPRAHRVIRNFLETPRNSPSLETRRERRRRPHPPRLRKRRRIESKCLSSSLQVSRRAFAVVRLHFRPELPAALRETDRILRHHTRRNADQRGRRGLNPPSEDGRWMRSTVGASGEGVVGAYLRLLAMPFARAGARA